LGPGGRGSTQYLLCLAVSLSQIIRRFSFSCHKFNLICKKIRVIFISLNKFIKKLYSKFFSMIPII
jgi:hypothetical protein